MSGTGKCQYNEKTLIGNWFEGRCQSGFDKKEKSFSSATQPPSKLIYSILLYSYSKNASFLLNKINSFWVSNTVLILFFRFRSICVFL